MSHFTEINSQNLHKNHKIKDFVLIDVREIFEYQEAHIENSINIPLSNILTEIEKYSLNKPIIMICRAGVRSRLACELLAQEGFDYTLYNLTGGIVDWQQRYELVQ